MNLKFLRAFYSIILFFLFFSLFSENEENFFTLIVLPDTQNYVKYEGNDKKFLKQCKWIVENKENLNIRFVLHEGDITDDNSPEQWEKAKNCMSILDGKIPYALCVGNHDISKNSKLSLI
ncbi:MAG TPA: metallophosphoesterase, partial [Victivallales bacterium]|nr:metallophosphoesterase [Victivallales bacterium]